MLTKKSIFHIFSFSLTLALTFSALGVTPARADATLMVNTALDADSGVDGVCSLREAIIVANSDADYNECTSSGYGADTITFDANYTITLGSQLPAVTTDITITGNGSANTIVQANAAPNTATYRVFEVSATGDLTLDGLTVRHGKTSSGGGVYNNGGALTVTNSAFSGNIATYGGGVRNDGALTITNSTFSGNGNSASYGGGVRNAGALTITNSTFSGNSALYGGGVESYSGTLTLTNSTLSGNSATYGGGIDNPLLSTATLKNTIVANSSTGGDCYGAGAITANAYNLDSDGSCGDATQKTTVEINLGALADNGGSTQTLALLPPSAAMDAGDDTVCDDNPGPNNLDQRGITRPQGAHCDIGAFEVQVQAGPAFIVNSSADTDDGLCGDECTLREAINAANAISGADTITFDANYTITLVSQLPAVTTDITITGNGAANTIIQASACNPVTLPGGCTPAAYRVFQVSGSGNLTLDSLTTRYGNANNGGGIYNLGTLTITNSAFSGNSADGLGTGGGIHNNIGILTITNSTFSGNYASYGGSGVFNENGALTVTNSTFSGNSADYGGGVFNHSVGTLTITNSSFSGNSATYYGGGIFTNSTTAITLKNTIVANSTSGGDCHNGTSAIDADTYNLDTDGSCGDATQKTTVEINLGALADNGGLTQTFALLPGSAAIDAGDDSVCDDNPGPNNLDQRGISRIGNGAHCDIGAFETEAQTGPTFIVNTNADTNDQFCDILGSGIGNKDCTLREAINAANAISGADTITFADNYTITLASQLPAVTTAVTITGNGAANTIVQASACNPVTLPDGCTPAAYRVFAVSAGGDLTLDSLTARHGKTGNGGGIYNTSTSTLTITNSAFSGNSASSGGGGIYNQGVLTITNSTFSGNSATYDGGIYNDGTLTITNSTFSGNSASSGDGGGGINNYGMLTITNSTFSGNSAPYGGGIRNTSGTTTLKNTIVANSTSGGDCFGAITADAYNLDSDGSCGDATQKATAEINLGALADNGGSTQTLALLPGSAAIDAGDDSVCDDNPGPNNLDQRGVTRPQGTHCDVGAFETEAQPGPTFIVNTNADTDDQSCDILGSGIGNKDCTLREAINAANAISGGDTITFAANYTITLASQLPAVTTAVTITGNGAANTIVQASACNPVTLPGGCTPAAYRVFEVSNTGNLTLTGLTVRHGKTSSGGGGVRNDYGALTVTSSTFSGNYATNGGGVYNNGGTLTVTSSTFSGNYATNGGGIRNDGALTLTNSTLSGNSANAYGGGVFNNSTTLTITNSTFSGNSANSFGGGVFNYNGIGTLTITNSTFSGNSATNGGGVYNNGVTFTFTLKNTIVANSTGWDCFGFGVITADAYNLDSDGTCGDATQKTSLEINFGALTGSPAYYPLLPGSAAIDAGDDSVCDDNPGPNNLDQRGVTRPQGTHCDIGAFELEAYTLTITSANGTVTKNPDQTIYHEGDVVQLTATPNDGWSFANWTGDLASNTNPDTVTIHGNTSVMANYTQNEYTLTITSANGTVTKNPNQATYHEGDVVQLTATPNADWSFSNWTGGLVSSLNPDTVTIHGNTSVTANYTQNEYTLTITSANGTVTKSPNQATYHEGDVVQLTATPNADWNFSNWTGGLVSSLNPDTVTIHGNTSVTANYTQNEYTLTITSLNGTVTKNPNQATYHEGDVVQLTSTPNTGWNFANWTGDLTSSANPDSVTIHGNTLVTANYTQNEYTLTITSLNGTVTKNPNQATYHEGDVVQLTAAPNTGWSFVNWIGGLTGTSNPDSVTIHGNTSVTANYSQIVYTLFLPLTLR